jgi:PAS domain S-box-containing protein
VFLDTKDKELMDKPEGFVTILETKFKNMFDGKTRNALYYKTPLIDSDAKSFAGMIGIIIDTTDRQLFKNVYSIIFDLIPNPIAYNDSSLCFVECNKAFCEFVGIDKQDIIGKNIYDVLDMIECHDVKNMFVNLIHIDEKMVRETQSHEYHIVRETTNNVYKLSKSQMIDQDSAIVGVTTVIVDITDDVRSQKNKTCKSCTLNSSMNSHIDPLFIIEPSGNIVFVNSSFCEFVEMSETELLDTCIYDVMPNSNFQDANLNVKKWENAISIKCKSATKVANVKIIPVINNKKHGMFSCGVITGV